MTYLTIDRSYIDYMMGSCVISQTSIEYSMSQNNSFLAQIIDVSIKIILSLFSTIYCNDKRGGCSDSDDQN